MQMQKKAREVQHCPHHGDTELKRRRGRVTNRWMWFCPKAECNHVRYEKERGL